MRRAARRVALIATRWLGQLGVTRVSAALSPLGPWRPTPDLAVTLRGAVEAALFDIACTRADRSCADCSRATTCLIPTWYDPGRLGSHRGRPFRIAVVERATTVNVDLWFFGPIPRPTAVVEAIDRAAATGLGPRRTPFQVRRLLVAGEGAPTVGPRGGSAH